MSSEKNPEFEIIDESGEISQEAWDRELPEYEVLREGLDPYCPHNNLTICGPVESCVICGRVRYMKAKAEKKNLKPKRGNDGCFQE